MALRIPGRARPKQPRPASLPPLEKSIGCDVDMALEAIGCHVTKLSQPRATMQTSGIPDRWFSHAAWGVYGWMELKRPGETRSRTQREWHAANQAAGVTVLVVTSAADAMQQVAALPRRKAR